MVKSQISSGLKFIATIILISFSLFFTSCSKEESFIEPAETSRIASSAVQTNLLALPELFGMYTTPKIHSFSIYKVRAAT